MSRRIKKCLGNFKLQEHHSVRLGDTTSNWWQTVGKAKTLFGIRKFMRPEFKTRYQKIDDRLRNKEILKKLFRLDE